MIKKIFALVLFCAPFLMFAQTFSNEPETFVKEIDKYLSSYDRVKTKAFIEEFTPVWLNEFSSDYRGKVVRTANLIAEKRLPAFPDMYGYIFSAYSFVKNKQPDESFDSWQTTIEKLLKSKKVKSFKTFIETCSGLFSNGTLYANRKHEWGVRGGTYSFKFEKNSPKIYFKNTTIYCYVLNKTQSKKTDKYVDSTIVRNTSGNYQPIIYKWSGRGGIVDWEKTGMNPKKNYVTITDYAMSLKATKISSDSAEVYSEFYEKPLLGSFIDIAKSNNKNGKLTYPQFTSFSKKIVKKSILPEIDYVGGFSLNGNEFVGVGFDNEPASLIFFKDEKTFVKATAMRFNISKEGVKVQNCRTTLYLSANDSIFHPGLILDYNIERISLSRDIKGIAQAPFSNSYHNLDMYVDKIIWYKKDPNLYFEWNFGSNNKIAKFESKNYFDTKLYSKLQGMGGVHPLVAVYKYYYKFDKKTYPVKEAANYFNLSTEQIIPILLNLSNLGFITYNSVDQTITVLPKTKNYIDARSGKKDYDDIVFTSDFNQIIKKSIYLADGSEDKQAIYFNKRAKELNKRKAKIKNFGILNMESFEFKLNELNPVNLSQTQRVIVFPNDGKITINKNRDFKFKGAVIAGKLELYLDDGKFDYDQFSISLSDVKTTLLRVKPIFGGGDRLIPMSSHISKFKGVLKIDEPNNKSGNNKKITHFPVLSTTENSYVYYNHKEIYNGTYDSSNFYFKLEPFVLDSLDNYDEYNVAFKGELRSSGIFPIFNETITIQKDYSFGFETNAPEDGYRFYGNDAKYKNDIRLSNRGLRGSGEINFLTSNSISDDFVFFEDSTMGISKFTNIAQSSSEGLDVPDVIGNNALVTYLPKAQKLKSESKSENLFLYDKEVVMIGGIELSKNGMKGRGATYFGKAELTSNEYDFNRWAILADTSNFNLADIDPETQEEKISFATNNVKSNVNFDTRKGRFESNDGVSIVDFPQNQYICYMDVFTWLMEDDKIDMENTKKNLSIDSDLDIAESNFFSVHPKQDSLNFRSPKAQFDLAKKRLDCDKVEYVDIADARIMPVDQKIIIYKKAKIDPLKEATIITNFITKYHKMTNATVEIKARRAYEAEADYNYIDSKKQAQLIHFDKVGLDSAYQTVAKGTVSKQTQFKLSNQFDFYGEVKLKASTKYLTFDGATRINHECDQFAKNWMKFIAEINPEKILIPVNSNMKDLDGNEIGVGIILRSTNDYDSLGIYPAFLSALENKNDKILFTSQGVLTYNDQAKEYRIASEEKLINRSEKGNYISLHVQSCSMKGDGLVDLASELPDVNMYAVGTINYNTATKKTSMNISGKIDHFYDEKAMEYMSNKIITTEDLTGIDFNRTTLEQSIKELVDEKTAENFKSDYAIKGEIKKVPKDMESPIYFSNLRLTWDDRNKAFVSKSISAIVNLYNVPIMKDFTVKLAIKYAVKNADRGNKLMYMVELPGGQYYFYHYERLKKDTKLQIFTSDKLLEAYLLELKADKRKQKKMLFEFANKSIYLSQFRALFGE